jgi:sulfate permease, SulP family
MNRNFFPDLSSGLVTGLLLSIISVTCANLVFSQFLNEYLSVGIFLSLLGAMIMSIVISYGSPLKYTVLSPQDTIAVICSIVAFSMLLDISEFSKEEQLVTVIAMVATTSISMGVIFYSLGRFKVGKLAEYIPYPVIAGFLAGTGALIAIAGVELNTSMKITQETFTLFFQPQVILHWLPEVIYAVLMIYIIHKTRKHYLLLTLLFLGAFFFYVIVWLSGSSIQEAGETGLLLGPFKDYSIKELTPLLDFGNIHWGVIFTYIPDYLIAAAFGVISLLFSITSIEVITNDEIDINKELRTCGLANILSGLVGSIGGFHQLMPSLLNRQLGASTLLSDCVRTLFIAGITFFGIPLIGLIPKAFFTTLLLYIGIKRIGDWLVLTYNKISFVEYLIIPVITFSMVTYGLVVGVFIGLTSSIILFAIRYSRIKIIKNELSGKVCTSNVVRDQFSKKIIQEHADNIHIIFLQSYIFFGNAISLVNKIRGHFYHEFSRHIHYLVLDFNKVLGADASTIYSFVKISRLCQLNGVQLILSNLPQNVINKIEAAKESGHPISFLHQNDLDHALEYCEEDILKIHGEGLVIDLEKNYRDLLPSVSKHPNFFKNLKRKHVKKGELVLRENDESDCLYFLEEGRIHIFVVDKAGHERRIKVLNKGTIVGEIGFILNINRTASIRATEDCILAEIHIDQLEKLRITHPEILADFYHDMLRIATIRFVESNQLIRLLSE